MDLVLTAKDGRTLKLRDPLSMHPKMFCSFGDEDGDPVEWAEAYADRFPEVNYMIRVTETKNFTEAYLYGMKK